MRRFVYLIVIVTLFSCKTTKNTKKDFMLNEKYKVISLNGIKELKVTPTITFNFETNIASGMAGCNGYNVDFTKDGNSLNFGLAIATKMYCTNMNIEKAFFNNLSKVTHFKKKDGKVELLDKSDAVLMVLE